MGDEAEKTSRRPHALGIALPVQGHINPMMNLARRLASRGCIVTLVNLESNHKKLIPLENQVRNSEPDVRFESIPDRVPVPVASLDIFSSGENRKIFREAYESMEADVVDLLQSKLLRPGSGDPITFILGDVYLPWVAGVADMFQVPKVIFSTTCASSVLVDFYIPRLAEAGEIPVKPENVEKPVTSSLPGLPSPMLQADLPTYFNDDPRKSDPSFARRYAKAKLLAECDWILINSCELLEGEAFRALQSQVNKNFIGVGPLLEETGSKQTEAAWKTDRGCLAWLDSRPRNSVLYISFGSLATMPPQQFLELAAGLKRSSYSFLWVVRPNLLVADDESSQKAVESAWEIIEEMKRDNKRLYTLEWAPQLEVLAHSSVGGFLTHCGWNSVLEALWYGVPLLGWPQLVEQNLVCRMMCGEWKNGVSMNRGGRMIDRDDVAGCINKLMGDEEIRSKCNSLKGSVRKSAGVQLDVFIRSMS